MKKLILIRHGDAGSSEEWDGDDNLRPLTKKGIEITEQMCDFVKKLILKVDLIISSPYLRAMQTSEIFKKKLHISDFKNSVHLTPLSQPEMIKQELSINFKKHNVIMCFGHEPNLSRIVSYFLESDNHEKFSFKKSGACCLQFEQDLSKIYLRWHMRPSDLKNLSL